MKRTHIAAFLLFIVVFLCIAEFVYIINCADNITKSIEKSQNLYAKGNKDAAYEHIINAKKEWEDKSGRIDMLLYHDYIDDISINILNLITYLEAEDTAGFYTTCNEALRKIESLKRSELPILENII